MRTLLEGKDTETNNHPHQLDVALTKKFAYSLADIVVLSLVRSDHTNDSRIHLAITASRSVPIGRPGDSTTPRSTPIDQEGYGTLVRFLEAGESISIGHEFQIKYLRREQTPTGGTQEVVQLQSDSPVSLTEIDRQQDYKAYLAGKKVR